VISAEARLAEEYRRGKRLIDKQFAAVAPVITSDLPKIPVLWDGKTGNVVYGLQPKQFQALELTPLLRQDDEPAPTKIGYGGAAGGGKSFLARAIAAVVAHRWPGSTTIIFRRTEQEVLDNHYQKFLGEIPRDWYRWNGKERSLTWLRTADANGRCSRTVLGHLRYDEDVFKYQGNEYDCMIFEEATHYTWFQVNWLIGNRLRASVAGARPFALFPSNPGNIGHLWFKRIFIDRRYDPAADERPDDYAFIQAFLSDNYELNARDPDYAKKLNTLAEPWRSWQRDGNFEYGGSMALPELDRAVHLVDYFVPPRHWTVFGAYDWGFQHPFSFGVYAANEDGTVFKLLTIARRHLQVGEQIEHVREVMLAHGLEPGRLTYVAAGHDAWHDHKARGENGPTVAERWIDAGFPLVKANISRITGLANMREYMAWKERGPLDQAGKPTPGAPAFYIMRNAGNLVCFEQLESRVPDPDKLEDVLKTNADENGEGGDDIYDETRYALASRPARAPSTAQLQPVRAWAPAALAHEYREGHVIKNHHAPDVGVIHPEFGEI
jgi:phage terminase large subunit